MTLSYTAFMLCLLALLCWPAAQNAASAAAIPVASLQAVYRDGQVFLTWKEEDTPPGTTFNVYLHEQPITPANLTQARKVGHHVEAHSARDWWQDPASFDADAKPGTPVGFRIASDAAPLDPQGGLFVHTVTAESSGPRYFAVTTSDAKGVENMNLVAGQNALSQPVDGKVAPLQAIWLGEGALPARGAGKGKSFTLSLHGRGGGKPGAGTHFNCLVFGNDKQGWREGIAFKFQLSISENGVRIAPSDRAWTGRPVLESGDKRDHCLAVNTWWYGYNSRIYETTLTPKTVVPNYSEERLLWMVRWAQEYLGTDPNKTYLVGGSMGGSGAVSMSLHHPNVFAATVAMVPIVSYTRRGPGKGSLARLECMCGPLDETAVTHEGKPFLEHMNGELNATRSRADLPYLFITHGRPDGSIPWENNPPFYRAMNAARQGFAVHWNDGDHSTAHSTAPNDVKAWDKRLERFALNRSFPVFSNCSDNRNPGNGERKDGDITGWFNRGLDWQDLVDTPNEYALTVVADYPGLQLPLTVDVTPRRVQQFKVKPGDKVMVHIGDAPPAEARADEAGLVTIRGVKVADENGTRVRLTR